MQKLLAELQGRERDGSDDRLDGGETMGHSLGRVPLGGREVKCGHRRIT